jgi:hypothetical protein
MSKPPFETFSIWRTSSHPAQFYVEIRPPIDRASSEKAERAALFMASAIRAALERGRGKEGNGGSKSL